MRFQRSALINFYDDPAAPGYSADGRGGHVSAVTGLIGEDLLIAIVQHYWLHNGAGDSRRLLEKCKELGKKGNWLDAWILLKEETLFQVEIKNWSAHSLGGRAVLSDTSEAILHAEADRRWSEYFGNGRSLPRSAKKVMIDMIAPPAYRHLHKKKLLLFWFPIADANHGPMSVATVGDSQLHVFSASMYLRKVRDEVLDLTVPRIEERLRILDTLIHRSPDQSFA